jgi:galactose mutarotase-like enzyme
VIDHPAVKIHTFARQAAVTLAAEEMEATFLPELGMLGASLTLGGQEFLSLHGGVGAFADGHTTGLPLLAPWANRLAARRYAAAGVDVDLAGLELYTDPRGLPIHGTMLGQHPWEVAWTDSGVAAASLRARFDYGAHAELLRAFPFPHEIVIEATVDGALSVTTTIRPTGDVAVPISFGYHPYFRLPRARRQALKLSLPARQHLVLDERGIPTGETTLERAENDRLGDRSFDDAFVLGNDKRLSLEGGSHRLTVSYDEGYPFAQVYAPAHEPFVALEPMTAHTNSLVEGDCPLVQPSDEYQARFTISVEHS